MLRSLPRWVAGIVLVGSLLAGSAAPAAAGTDRWRKLPPLPGRADYVTHIGLELGDVLWAMAGTSVAYWDGSRFRRAQRADLSSGPRVESLLGGPDRGLYATQRGTEQRGTEQRGTEQHRGKLYRLCDGTAQYVTDFYYQDAGKPPGVYVSRSGRLLNFDDGLLAVHTGDGWKKSEAQLAIFGTFVFDVGKKVYFYHKQKLYGVDAANHFSAVDVPVQFHPDARDIKGTLWGNDRALMLAYSYKGVQAFELATGRLVDTSKINDALGGESVYDLFTAPDGSVWVLALNRPLQSYVFHRITPQGECHIQRRTAGYAWDNHQFLEAPQSVFCAADGSFWFGLLRTGILHYRPEGENRLFDGRGGLNLTWCTTVLQDSKGTVYAASSYGIYVLEPTAADSSANQAADVRPAVLDSVAWKYTPDPHRRIDRAWHVGGTIVTWDSARELNLIDAATGRRRGQIEIGNDARRDVWVVPGGNPQEMLVSAGKKVGVFDTTTGRRRQTTDFPLDPRIAPFPLEDGYLVVKDYRGRHLVRINHEGQERWSCPLPGYVRLHPTVYGAFVVVQTRGSSYGGQTTVGVDLNTGEVLWSETTNAYGCGAAFGDDAAYVVESDQWLSPEATEGRLICRDPRSGKIRWQYCRQGLLSHAPLVDRATDRVFAVFDRGDVVCLRAGDGSVLWNAALPENPRRHGGLSYEPYQPVVSQHADRLLVLDRNHVLQVLNVETGKVVARLALTTAFSDDGRTMVPIELVTMPWIRDGNLIVATVKGIVAYRVGQLLADALGR